LPLVVFIELVVLVAQAAPVVPVVFVVLALVLVLVLVNVVLDAFVALMGLVMLSAARYDFLQCSEIGRLQVVERFMHL
jgi:hypothetical protein